MISLLAKRDKRKSKHPPWRGCNKAIPSVCRPGPCGLFDSAETKETFVPRRVTFRFANLRELRVSRLGRLIHATANLNGRSCHIDLTGLGPFELQVAAA